MAAIKRAVATACAGDFRVAFRFLFREVARLLVGGRVEDEGTRLRSGSNWEFAGMRRITSQNGVFRPPPKNGWLARSGARVSASRV